MEEVKRHEALPKSISKAIYLDLFLDEEVEELEDLYLDFRPLDPIEDIANAPNPFNIFMQIVEDSVVV